MCGICGIIGDKKENFMKENIDKMVNSMHHRGPDDKDIFIDKNMALGSSRLRIIDLNCGAQPFLNEDKTIILVANGEIYNFQDLRELLLSKGHVLKTYNDLEVIPHLYEEYGLKFLNILKGMFSLALWDKSKGDLIIAKDRFGIKPLHYASIGGIFIFGSEIKSLLSFPGINKSIDLSALNNYLMLDYIPSPRSIFKNIRKLPPAHYLIYKNKSISLKRYWTLRFQDTKNIYTKRRNFKQLSELLDRSIGNHLVSDVPIGVFLSGGLDSSYMLSRVKQFYPSKVKTFSIGFAEPSFDESKYSKSVAAFLGTEHRHKYVGVKDVVEALSHISDCLDEPLGDGSLLPTYLLSNFSRKNVTVALSGDGGDEIFAGYPTYVAHRLMKLYMAIPRYMRRNLIEKIILRLPVSDDNFSFDFCAKRFVEGAYEPDIMERHVAWMGSFNRNSRNQLLKGHFKDYVNERDYGNISSAFIQNNDIDELSALQYFDINTYLAEDLLVKADRVSMMNSQEIRVPYLDHELVEFVINLPLDLKMRYFRGKYILREKAAECLPRHIINRPKKGFGMPVSQWIKQGLKQYILDMLSESRIRREGFFNYEYIKTILDDHFKNKVDNRKRIWTLFMFELWYQKYMG